MLVGATLFYKFDNGTGFTRIHQHREEKEKVMDEKGSNRFSTHLPIMIMDTNGAAIPGAKKDDIATVTTNIKVIDQKDVYNHKEDVTAIDAQAQIAYRGNSSRNFDKKPFQIRFDKEADLLGMGEDEEWVLNGPILDRTLMRNYLCYNVAGEIMEFAPECRYLELYVNDQYLGVYLAIETIKQSKDRVHIQKTEEKKDITSYIVRWDRSFKGDHRLHNFTYYTKQAGISALDIRYPGKTKLTDGKMKYIEEDISKIEKLLYSYDLNYSDREGYTKYIDRKAFAQYFVINEFFSNVDAGRFSTFFYKDVRGKLKPVVWDFNNVSDNYFDEVYGSSGFSLYDAPWFNMLLKDKDFVDTVLQTYRDLRKGVLSEQYLLNYIDETRAFLGDAITRNNKKWGYVFDLKNWNTRNYLTPKERNYTSYEQSVEQLKGWIKDRGVWLDDHIDTLYQYCHDSKTKNTLLR